MCYTRLPGEKLLLLQVLLLLCCFRAGVGGGGGAWQRSVSKHMLETESLKEAPKFELSTLPEPRQETSTLNPKSGRRTWNPKPPKLLFNAMSFLLSPKVSMSGICLLRVLMA